MKNSIITMVLLKNEFILQIIRKFIKKIVSLSDIQFNMGKHFHIPIKQCDDKTNYIITKNAHLTFLIQGSYKLYSAYKKQLEQECEEFYVENESFRELVFKLTNDKDSEAIVDQKDLQLLMEWIDVIIQLTLETETTNFKDNIMKQYMKTASNFVGEIKKYIPIEIKLNDN